MPRIYKLKVVLFERFDPCKSVLSVLSVVRFGFFRQSCPDHPICLTILLSSSTCKCGGQFFQLCRQHTIMSHFKGS